MKNCIRTSALTHIPYHGTSSHHNLANRSGNIFIEYKEGYLDDTEYMHVAGVDHTVLTYEIEGLSLDRRTTYTIRVTAVNLGGNLDRSYYQTEVLPPTVWSNHQ